MYAMYVIGQVESNHNWAAINRNDPITLGMMQWYGNRAKSLLLRGQSEDKTGFDTCNSNDGGMCDKALADADMTYYYTNDLDSQAWQAWANTDANHKVQQNQWNDDYAAYEITCNNYGFPTDNQRERVFFMTMWHQSPASALRVMQSCSATANLELLYTTCLNDRVLGAYRTRYTTAYNLLKGWDGQAAPPDFGQIEDTGSSGGNPAPIQPTPASTMWIRQQGDNLVLYNESNILMFKKASAYNWVYSASDGQQIEGGQTGGGSSSGSASADQQKVYDLYKSWTGRFQYSQGPGRLDPLNSGYGDCSSTIWRAYQDALGINVGTWTGAMKDLGQSVGWKSDGADTVIGRMQTADLILFTWPGGSSTNFDHVEMYTGDGTHCLGHGGPGMGPIEKDLRMQMNYAQNWNVRRYVN